MILPTKYVSVDQSVLGLAAMLIDEHQNRSTVNQAWAAFVERRPALAFDRFVEALTLLYVIGVVRFEKGILLWGEASL